MNNIQKKIVDNVMNIVKKKFEAESSGHDWWHIYRVWRNSIRITNAELKINTVNLFIVELAALLHDIADWKFYNGNQDVGPKKAARILEQLKVDKQIIKSVKYIIQNLSFKGAKTKHNKMNTIEGQIVQDADRLDAIGAIGIARTFTYGGYKNRTIYNPAIKPVMHENATSYIKNSSPTINHFYEKLLLLKNLMNTESGKKIAIQRHQFMKTYLDQFYKEWNLEN